MPDIKIVKIKLRRGSEIQRKLVTFDQGELGYVTDTKRVFVGDGTTTGGTVVGSRFFTPIASNKVGLAAYAGDVVAENNLMYQLTGTDATQTSAWGLISPIIDNQTIDKNTSNVLRIKPSGVGVAQLGTITYAQGAIVKNSTQGLSANVDNTTIVVNGANQLALSTVYASSIIGQINNTQIDTTTVAGSALQGTASGKLDVRTDNSSIIISSNQLTVGTVSLSSLGAGTFGESRIASTALGDGLQGGNGIQISTKLNGFSMEYKNGGAITLATLFNAAKIPLSSNDIAFRGLNSIYGAASAVAVLNDVLSTVSINIVNFGSGYSFIPTISVQPPTPGAGFYAASATATLDGGTLSAITLTDAGSGYNFVPQVLIDAPTHNETLYQVTTATAAGGVSTSAQTFNLSSAGFIMIDFGADLGGKFAVPIFRVPAELQGLTISEVTV
jgi:hypothetical protein